MEKNKGITLIALVITIIVLLILAAVSIATLTGENGILTQANKAKNKTEQAREKEQIELAYTAVKSKKMETGDNTKISAEDLNDEFDNDGVEAQATDGEEGKIKVTFSKTGNEYTIDENGKVEFEEKIPLIKATSIKAEDLTIEAGVKTKQLNVTTTPSEITEELIYTSKNEEIATVDNKGKVTARGEGTAEVEIKGEKSGTKTTCNVTVEFGVGVKVRNENKTYGTAIIPVGFCIVPGCDNLEEGLVISDNDEDTEADKDNIVAEGNQFVWVPVKDFSKFERENGYSYGKLQESDLVTNEVTNGAYYEPDADSEGNIYTSEKTLKEVKKMYESVEVNKGFYIGRYEAGAEGGKVVCKKGVIAYDNIKWGENMTNETGGAVDLARGFAEKQGYTSVKSTLCYGVQWDAVIRWMKNIENINVKNGDETYKKYIEDSTKMGWYSDNSNNGPKNTGIDTGENNKSNKVKNIYDMAGNVWEWTMEAFDNYIRVYRGGGFDVTAIDFPISGRGGSTPESAGIGYGFRPTLYLCIDEG